MNPRVFWYLMGWIMFSTTASLGVQAWMMWTCYRAFNSF